MCLRFVANGRDILTSTWSPNAGTFGHPQPLRSIERSVAELASARASSIPLQLSSTSVCSAAQPASGRHVCYFVAPHEGERVQRCAARQRRHIRQWRGIFNPQYLQCGTARQQDVRHSRAAPEFDRAQRCAACQRNVRQFRAVRKSERVQCCAARQRDTSVTFKKNSSLSVCSVVQPTSADTSVTSSTRGLSAPASQRSSVPRSQARRSACACRAAASIAPALTLPMDSRSPGARPGSRAKRKAARAVRPEVAETARPRRVRRPGQNIRPTIVVVSPYPPARRYGIDAPAGPKLQG